jgi:hypothetical protein
MVQGIVVGNRVQGYTGQAAKKMDFPSSDTYRFHDKLFCELNIGSKRTIEATIAGVPCTVFADDAEYKYGENARWVLDGTTFVGTVAIFANPIGHGRSVRDVQLTVNQVVDRCDLFTNYHEAYKRVYGVLPIDIDGPPTAPAAECNAA